MEILVKGLLFIVDTEDYENLFKDKWYVKKSGNNYYLFRTYNKKTIYLHREIIKAKEGEVVDHANGNSQDNRKSNLRICTMSQNIANSRLRKGNTSGFKGVGFDRSRGKWRAQIMVNYKNHFLGRYNDIEEAKCVYKKAANHYFGEYTNV